MQSNFIISNILKKVMIKNSTLDGFKEIPPDVQKDIILEIFSYQSSTVEIAMSKNESIQLMYLGTFKVKPGRQFVLDTREKLAIKYGYDCYANATDEDKDVIKEELKAIVSKQFLADKLKRKKTNPFNRATIIRNDDLKKSIKKSFGK